MQPWVCVKPVMLTGTVTTSEFRLWKGEVFWRMVKLFWYEIDIACAWTIICTIYTGTFLGINIVTLFTGFLKYDKNDLEDMILQQQLIDIQLCTNLKIIFYLLKSTHVPSIQYDIIQSIMMNKQTINIYGAMYLPNFSVLLWHLIRTSYFTLGRPILH